MYLDADLHTTLTAMRHAEIRREVVGAYRARQAWTERTVAETRHGFRAPLRWWWGTVVRALVPGSMGQPLIEGMQPYAGPRAEP